MELKFNRLIFLFSCLYMGISAIYLVDQWLKPNFEWAVFIKQYDPKVDHESFLPMHDGTSLIYVKRANSQEKPTLIDVDKTTFYSLSKNDTLGLFFTPILGKYNGFFNVLPYAEKIIFPFSLERNNINVFDEYHHKWYLTVIPLIVLLLMCINVFKPKHPHSFGLFFLATMLMIFFKWIIL